MKTINSTTGQRHAAQFGTFDSTGQWERNRANVHGALLASDRIKALSVKLPHWHFEAYGNGGAVACYPANGTNAASYSELSAVAPISSVCGPLYVITEFRNS